MSCPTNKTRAYQSSCVFLNQIGGDIATYRCRTYLPESYSERPPLHVPWREREEQKARRRAAAGITDAPSLAELMAERAVMTQEMEAAQAVREQGGRRHAAVLDRTPDLAHGALDTLLAETRRLTSSRR